MTIRTLILLLGLLSAVAFFPVSAGAETTADCQAQIAELREQTAAVTTFANPRDQSGLINKLDNASAALALGKDDDAIRKLTDFSTKVQALGAAGKLAGDDAALLNAGALAAITCITPASGA